MAEKLDKILEEIYAVDASLRKQDVEVRALVSEMLEARPSAAPDRAFIASLRKRVVEEFGAVEREPSRGKKKAKTESDWLWWILRVAPVGAIAILMLMLVPQQSGRNVPPGVREFAPETVPTAMPVSDIDSAGNAEMMNDEASSMKMAAPESGGEAVGTEMMDTMMVAPDEYSLQQDTSLASGNVVDVFTQNPGNKVIVEYVSLEAEGYVRIFSYANGNAEEALGTSGVLPAGTSQRIVVPLSRRVNSGEVLQAQLFTSDGDAIFEQNEDLPLYDNEGGFIYMLFMVLWPEE